MTPENTQAASTPPKPGESTTAFELSDTGTQHPDTPVGAAPPPGTSETVRPSVGTSLGKYWITGVLGEGGMGVVL